MTKFKPLALLLGLAFLSSCEKETLISKENIRDFKIDTLFYEELDIANFYVSSEPFGVEPIITEENIFMVVINTDLPLFQRTTLYNINTKDGSIIWKWSDYAPSDHGSDQDLSYSNGKLLLRTMEHLYIIDASTGQSSIIYTPQPDEMMGGAALYNGYVYLAYRTEQGVYLIRMNTDGGNAMILHSVQKSASYIPIVTDLKILQESGTAYLSYQVSNILSYSTSSSLFVSLLPDPSTFLEFTLGNSNQGDASGLLLSDGYIYTLEKNGRINCFRISHYDQLVWAENFNGQKLFANDKYLYATSDKGLAIFNKLNGNVKFSGGGFQEILALNNGVIITPGNTNLRIFDAETAGFLMAFGQLEYEMMFRKITETEFFFTSYASRHLGKIRITEKFK